jgi:galactose mutarotase-like enzyme
MYTIETDSLKVVIDPKGAELKSILHKHHHLEYMWSGDPAYWGKTSPVLFPIVGQLKDNTYLYKGKKYHLPRHGFARDKTFTVSPQDKQSISFTLQSDESTRAIYPFTFRFSIIYSVEGEDLTVRYVVENEGDETMLFSVGGHPAFRLPLVAGTDYDDYKLVFETAENTGRWPISKEGLIEQHPQPLFLHTRELPLTKDLFQKDAVVFKHLASQAVTIRSGKTPHGLTFYFPNFPYLGLWAAPGADFLCIEPWCGIADSVNTNQQLESKEGIIPLAAHGNFEAEWRAQFY